MKPKITIITPTIDVAHYIDYAVRSVPRHEAGDGEIEHIVVHDGESGFVDRLRADYPWLRIMKGSGRGATAATAAGVAAAAGDFFILLNSDDRMEAGSIAALLTAAARRPDIDVWTGGTRIFETGPDGAERVMRVLDRPEVTALTLSNVLDDLPMMTSRFVSRRVYDRIGNYDTHFSACSDREFAIRMVLAGVKDASLGVLVSDLRSHDASRTIRGPGRDVPPYLEEHLEIARGRMSDASLASPTRNVFREWHAHETVRKAFYEFRVGRFAGIARTLRAAFEADRRWPFWARSLLSGRRLRRR